MTISTTDGFGDMLNQVFAEIDEDQLTTLTGQTSNEVIRVKNYLNEAYKVVLGKKPDWSWARFSQTVSTVASTSSYTLAATTDTEKIHLVQITTEPPMELLSYGEFKRKYGAWESSASGKPYIAYVLDGLLYFYPTPDQVYSVTVEASKLYAAMSADNDEPLIPAGKRDVLVHYVTARATTKDQDPAAASHWQLFQDALQRLKDSENNNNKGYYIIPEDETVVAEDWQNRLYF